MTDQTFELRLQAAYDVLASEATVEIDPSRSRLLSPTERRPWFDWLRRLGLSELAQDGAGRPSADDRTARSGSRRRPDRPAVAPVQGSLTPGPDMSAARDRPIVVALGDGRVVIAAGQLEASTAQTSAEIFDPRSGEYSNFKGDIPTGFGRGLLLRDGRA